jgi:hypothetical protein
MEDAMRLPLFRTPVGENLPASGRGYLQDGLSGLYGRLRHRDGAAYQDWLEERDMIVITATLMRLSERQLNRLGMSRQTLAMDVEDLAERAARDRDIARDVLEIVEDDRASSIAAE